MKRPCFRFFGTLVCAAVLPACFSHRPTASPALPTTISVPLPDGADPSPEANPSSEVGPPSAQRPPQFVVVSFDGAGSVALWEYWRSLARETGAHFTFFVSGVYFLTRAEGALYHPPHAPPGTSDIHFLPVPRGATDRDYEAQLLRQMSDGHREGHEIATHFNGHFCGPSGVTRWVAADWSSELDSFFTLLDGASTNNSIEPAVELSFGKQDIVGARTPCLEGNKAVLYPLLAGRGFRYDASQVASQGDWPHRQDGIWSFPLVSIPFAGTRRPVLSMDYNLYATQSGAHDAAAAREARIEQQAYRTFTDYVDASYNGNRAPISIGAHFSRWNHDAYIGAITRVLKEVCRRPETRCVSYAELADWLDTHPQTELPRLVGDRGSGQARAPAS